VAAALYGVGARLDREPELFFRLRQIDQTELISEATQVRGLVSRASPSNEKTLAADSLSEIFGIEVASEPTKPGRQPSVIAAKRTRKRPRREPPKRSP
jgi:uncharacterized Zn finger protein